jgi:hypothetical protein
VGCAGNAPALVFQDLRCAIAKVGWDCSAMRVQAAVSKVVECPETKKPACFLGRQGSQTSMIYSQIVNYQLASLVTSSLVEF